MDVDLQLSSGRLRARRFGDNGDRLVLGIPGLTANLVSFERLAEAAPMTVLDLRGRGLSEITPPGTYGWERHADDVLEAASRLGAERFSVVGWSMGAYVSMAVARRAPGRLEKVVLIDALGPVDELVVNLIRMSVNRLGTVYPSLAEYMQLVRSTGLIDPWDESWERYFAYELKEVDGGVVARTDRAAVEEDFAYGESITDPRPYWAALTMPTLLVRATRPLVPGMPADIISPALLAEFRAAAPQVEMVEIDANHYGVAAHPDAVAAVRRFLT